MALPGRILLLLIAGVCVCWILRNLPGLPLTDSHRSLLFLLMYLFLILAIGWVLVRFSLRPKILVLTFVGMFLFSQTTLAAETPLAESLHGLAMMACIFTFFPVLIWVIADQVAALRGKATSLKPPPPNAGISADPEPLNYEPPPPPSQTRPPGGP